MHLIAIALQLIAFNCIVQAPGQSTGAPLAIGIGCSCIALSWSLHLIAIALYEPHLIALYIVACYQMIVLYIVECYQDTTS